VEISKESLYAHYKNYSDESLLEAAGAGPESYSPAAWSVIQELIASRQLASDATMTPPPLAPCGLPPGELEVPHISPYFILSRLLRGQRWPADKSLPMAGQRFLADLALFFGAIGGLATLILMALPSPRDRFWCLGPSHPVAIHLASDNALPRSPPRSRHDTAHGEWRTCLAGWCPCANRECHMATLFRPAA
jgi:hypothetical protein